MSVGGQRRALPHSRPEKWPSAHFIMVNLMFTFSALGLINRFGLIFA
jgi:hypothetical protein